MAIRLTIAVPAIAGLLLAAVGTQMAGSMGFAGQFVSTAQAQETEWQKVDEALGRKAAVSGDVHRYGFPRSDLTVTLDGVSIKPSLALGGWIAFKPTHGGAMAMGDLVLLETEVAPVVAKLTEGGFEITAIHNHLLRANPATFYVHVLGHGDPVTLAGAIHDGLAASKTPLSVSPAGAPPAIDLDTTQLDQIIGVKGQNNGGVYAFAVPRRDPVSEGGMEMTPVGPMGVAHAINFQPTGGGKAAITGDFVLTGDEVNPVINSNSHYAVQRWVGRVGSAWTAWRRVRRNESSTWGGRADSSSQWLSNRSSRVSKPCARPCRIAGGARTPSMT